MAKFKKVAVTLAVIFLVSFGAGIFIFNAVADMVQTSQEANYERD